MANDEPPYLTVGTDVSAKYKGAFCEAKIKKANRVVKCKVTFKNSLGSFMVTDDLIKGSLRIGAEVEAKHPEKNQFLEAVINKLQDYSQYTVVFDDGDETTLRRTSLCLKSGRHFAESPTLDQFPLTNPEHFGTPVIGAGKYKRKRRSTFNSSVDYESSDDDPFPRKLKAIRGKERDPDLGKVVAVDYGDRRKKDSWYPGLIVPHPAQSTIKISKEEHLIRSFKDGKYYQVPKRDTREFIKDSIPKIENNALKIAVDKAILYLEKDELPTHWDKALFMGLELPSADEDSQDSDTDSSDDEPSEDKDRFVAQLYKFMDERGTPINKGPTVSSRDLNLYKLFKIMHKLGGFNKVTNQNKWKAVYSKMGLPQSNINGPSQIKCAYKRYLQSFEDFNRKLGCTMVNNSRSTRGRYRSDRNFIITRTRDRETSSPKGRNSKDAKDKATTEKKTDDKPRTVEKKEIKTDDTPKAEEKPKSPEKKKIEKTPKNEEKDDKKKKDERPRLARSQSLNKDKKDNSFKEDEKKDVKPEKARTREDARKEKSETPEKKGTRSSLKIEMERKEKEETIKDKKDQSPKGKEKKEEKLAKDVKEEKPKEKKDEKILKDRKVVKDKKVEEKPVKEKTENAPKEKKDEKPIREKRDSSKEPKEDKIKGRKEDVKPEEKTPVKKKFDRLVKDKKEEKVFRPRRENRSPMSETKKSFEEIDLKTMKEEKQKVDMEVKKEDSCTKEKPGPKLRERREGTPFSDDGEDVEADVSDNKDTTSRDGFEKKGPGPRLKGDGPEEPPNRGRKKSLKFNDKDEKDCEDLMTDSDDETFGNDQDKDSYKDLKSCEIELGDRVKVKYGTGKLKKVYEAKVLKIQTDGSEKRYFVHYNGWNNRYDEWVRRNFIVALVNPNKQKPESSMKSCSSKRIDKGRPPGPIVPSKPTRKNSTSSTNSSLSCSRATRSDKKSLQSPLSSGLESKTRTRKKSGLVLGLTDTSQDSDSDIEETMDLDDDDIGDADVEDNANPQNDSCFKEELFSDDEEKEKLEDVKRDDITELEKAISVEETAEDVKTPFFTPVKKEISEAETSIKDNLEAENKLKSIKEASFDEPKKESSVIEVVIVREKSEINVNVQNVTPVKTEKEQVIQPENVSEVEKKSCPETLVIANISKNIIKPAKMLPILSISPEPKSDKTPFSSTPIKISPLNIADQKKEFLKCSFAPIPLASSENRSSLSFAGLQGLIQISSFDKTLLQPKIEPPKIVINPPPKIDLKLDSDVKSLTSSLFRPEKLMPVFGSNCLLSPPKLPDPIKNVENPLLKNTPSIFSFLSKPSGDKEHAKDLKPFESAFKLASKDVSKDKSEIKNDDSKNLKTPDSIEKVIEPTTFKHCIISPAKFCAAKVDPGESKTENVKDRFDLLVENSKTSELKKPEIKDNIFSLSFPSITPKDRFLSADKPYSKALALSAENLCIKSKPSETFDLSKTIPSIIERLKKDVVADLKVTDSPPPQKEELNFNFLRGSQDTVKSLSRSDSSNSLRICEDMSDTNDSNTNSKDLIINEKFDATSVVSSNSASDNAVPCPSENLMKLSDLTKSESPLDLIPATSNEADKKDEAKSSKTSVITVASTNPVPVICSEVKNDTKDVTPSESNSVSTEVESDEKKVENTLVKSDEVVAKEVSVLLVKEADSKAGSIPNSDNKEKEPESKSEPPNVSSKSEKDSLFDDLLKIKNTNTNFNQSSVIMWNPDTKATVPVDEKAPISEEKAVAGKEETPLIQKVDQQEPSKDAEASSSVPVKNESDAPEDKDLISKTVTEIKSDPEDNENLEDNSFPLLLKKEGKKKKLSKKLKKFSSSDGFEKEDKEAKMKDGKSKKKRLKMENDDSEKGNLELKSKSKKIKKNKNKKRLAKFDELMAEHRKGDIEDDNKDFTEKMKRKEKRKSEKKFFKSGFKGEFSDSKLEMKKKKGKKNRDKLSGEKKDFLEKKTKKRKKLHIEDNQDTDSDKEAPHKSLDKKKKKDRKKFKTKDSSSSDDTGDKFFKEQSKMYNSLPSCSVLARQDSKSDDPDMSFLLCEEKVPASPVGISNMADDTSGSSSIEGNRIDSPMDILPLPNVCPLMDNIESSNTVNKHSIDTSAVLDNTPPTTPSSTESLLSSSPSHERDSFSMNYPESTQSGRDSGEGESDLFHCNSNRTISKKSDEYHVATTLAFGVGGSPMKSKSDKPKEDAAHNFLKHKKSDVEERSPSKRRKKSKRLRRYSESAKSPRHKPSLSRISKVESCCEDSSGASPAASSSPPYSNTSTMSFSRSPHRMSCSSEGFSRYNSKYNFYVPLHEKDPEKRIAILQEKMANLRKEYMALRAKVVAIDHKRRRARKKIREAGAATSNPTAQSEDGPGCS